MTPLNCGFELGFGGGIFFFWMLVTKYEKFRLRKWRTQCNFFIKLITAGVCFPHKVKDMGDFP